MQKHRHQEWIKFLKLIDAETPPELDLHLIVEQLCDPQASEGPGVAEAAQAFPHPLHPHQQFVAEPGRTLVPPRSRTSAFAAKPSVALSSFDPGDYRVHSA